MLEIPEEIRKDVIFHYPHTIEEALTILMGADSLLAMRQHDAGLVQKKFSKQQKTEQASETELREEEQILTEAPLLLPRF